MKVSLINYTQEARELLLFTKQTRLSMDNGLMDEIRAWPEEKKQSELKYMLGTIKSSWEFCDYVFSISGVSRAFTHQFVRTRQGSFAQQSQRTVEMDGFDFVTPEAWLGDEPFDEATGTYVGAMGDIQDAYDHLISIGANPQDARGILPTNICTNIIGKFNLRTLSDMARIRLCTRTQGEYQNVFRAMRSLVVETHPWAEPFVRVACAADGVCCFPNYAECPIKPGVFNPDTGLRWDGKTTPADWSIYDTDPAPVRPHTREEIQVIWEGTRFEAVPKEMKRATGN
jgi:flavin-dependent thymidylate synthase